MSRGDDREPFAQPCSWWLLVSLRADCVAVHRPGNSISRTHQPA